MMKVYLILGMMFLLIGCVNDVEDTEQQLCEESDGEWREFSNACADRCDAGDICAQVITESCDCGPDMCWTGSSCIAE